MPPDRPDANAQGDLAAHLDAAFSVDGATLSGTTLLFNCEARGITPTRPATWHEVAERINEVGFESPPSFQPEDFRYYLPGLLLGCLRYLKDKDSPVPDYIISDLYSYPDDRYWDQRFIERWCRFTPAQYDVIEKALGAVDSWG